MSEIDWEDAERFAKLHENATHIYECERNLARAYLALVAERERLKSAIDKIEGQAVCVNMDGDAGNERMLKNIAQLAREALRDGGGDA